MVQRRIQEKTSEELKKGEHVDVKIPLMNIFSLQDDKIFKFYFKLENSVNAYSRQQNPYNVLYFWKDMSIVHEVNILNL